MQSLTNEADDISHSRMVPVTVGVFEEYRKLIIYTTSDLEKHLEEIDNNLENLSSQGSGMSDEGAAERKQIQEEKDNTEQCLAICAQASVQVAQGRTVVCTYRDTYQVVVISARCVTAGVRSTQLLGQMSDATPHTLEPQSGMVEEFEDRHRLRYPQVERLVRRISEEWVQFIHNG